MKTFKYTALVSLVILFFACSGNNTNTNEQDSAISDTTETTVENHCIMADSCANSETCTYNHGNGTPCGRAQAAIEQQTKEDALTK